MFGLFKRKPDPSEAARELGAIPRRNERQRLIETTDALRRQLGLPPYQWRPIR